MKRSTNLTMLAVMLSLVMISGCAQPAPAPAISPSPSAKPPANPEVILATTTSTADTGLLDAILPTFEKKTGYKVKPIAVGTGQALTMGERGEADVLLVHAPSLELPFMQNAHGVNRKLVMHNDFVVVGPASDPAGIKGMTNAVEAFKKLAAAKAPVISRGVNSGTDTAEMAIWKAAGITPVGQTWYQQSGQGMGASLLVASEKNGYAFTDRGTYLKIQKNLALQILVQGDTMMLNVYHIIQVNPMKSTKINADGGKAFVEFMISADTQKFIATFGVSQYGQPLFFPDADKTEADLGSY